MSGCIMCGQRGVDGALDHSGDFVCVDCWATGEAAFDGRRAVTFVGADVPYHVYYPADMQARFLAACNPDSRESEQEDGDGRSTP